ncbi:hypothetical protein [Natrinema soli]|uniref:Uncharacterized protein n=1 Tax=Natrinema soli TaxID=1930624 RepID=A0ABD5SM99_9EURY|nr:hypothetical protein [Natrinema soli]
MYTHYARGDDRPVIHDQLTRGRTPISLGADDTVHLYVEDPEGEIFIADQATVVDRPESRVEYEMNGGWPLAGTYKAEWVIEYVDGGTRTVPSGSPKEIPVREILDRQADVREYDDPDLTLENLWVNRLGANTASAVAVESPLDLERNDVTGIGHGEAESFSTAAQSVGAIGDVEGAINTNQTEIATNKSDIDGAETAISQNQSDVESLQDRTSGLSSDGTEADLESVRTMSLDLGDRGPITGVIGDTGEWIPMMTIARTGSHSTTSTNFTNVLAGSGRIRMDFTQLNSISGIESIGASYTASYNVPTTETIEVELFSFSGVAISSPVAISVSDANWSEKTPDIGVIDPESGSINFEYRIRSVGGEEVAFRAPTLTIYGRIA